MDQIGDETRVCHKFKKNTKDKAKKRVVQLNAMELLKGDDSVLPPLERQSLFEKYSFHRNKRKRESVASSPTCLIANPRRFPTNAQRRHKEALDNARNIPFFGWKWKRTAAEVEKTELMIRYIQEETDGDQVWLMSDTLDPFLYIYYMKEGYFLLRQIADAFIEDDRPDRIKRQLLYRKMRKVNRHDGCMTKMLSTKFDTELYTQIRESGVTRPLCMCCGIDGRDTGKPQRCNRIDIINVQGARMITLESDAPCSRVLPLLETIIQITSVNKKKRALTSADKQTVLMAQRCKCYACDEVLDWMEGYEVHHKFRVCEGGSNRSVNLYALCPSCHRKCSQDERIRPFTRFRCLPQEIPSSDEQDGQEGHKDE